MAPVFLRVFTLAVELLHPRLFHAALKCNKLWVLPVCSPRVRARPRASVCLRNVWMVGERRRLHKVGDPTVSGCALHPVYTRALPAEVWV